MSSWLSFLLLVRPSPFTLPYRFIHITHSGDYNDNHTLSNRVWCKCDEVLDLFRSIQSVLVFVMPNDDHNGKKSKQLLSNTRLWIHSLNLLAAFQPFTLFAKLELDKVKVYWHISNDDKSLLFTTSILAMLRVNPYYNGIWTKSRFFIITIPC